MKSKDLITFALPDAPGVYFFKQGSTILYIGRATSLKDRVRSYFSDEVMSTRGAKIVDMVTRADTLNFKETSSVLEAIILEAHLIKEHLPSANSDGKDDKSFNHVVITKDDFPQVLVVRGKDLKEQFPHQKIKYEFGPFPEGGLLKEALKIIRKIFPYRDEKCFPPQPGERGRPCFNRQVGLCPGVCTGEISKKEYGKTIQRLKLFFQGKTDSLIRSIERDMKAHARAHEFERAHDLKRVLFGLQHIQDVALIKVDDGESPASKRGFRVEAYDVAHISGKHMVGVMVVAESGQIATKHYRTFNIRGFTTSNDPGALREVISRRLNHPEWSAPDLVVVDGNEVQRSVAASLFGSTTPVVAVTKDSRHKPLTIVGDPAVVTQYEKVILRLNAEAHRFAIKRFRSKARRSLIV